MIPIYYQTPDEKIFLGNSCVIPRIGDKIRVKKDCPAYTVETIFWEFIDEKPQVSLSYHFKKSGH